jgi:hypothetical protein
MFFKMSVFFVEAIICISAINCIAGEKQIDKQTLFQVNLAEPKVIRADVVYDYGPALVPWIVRAKNGNWIVSFHDKNDQIPGAVTHLVRSENQGRTWSKPFLSIKGQNPPCELNVILQNLPDGNIACGILEVEWKDSTRQYYDFYYSISTDNGTTFNERQRLNDPNERKDFAQGKFIQLPNGDLLWPWGRWDPKPFAGFRRSIDGGKTWQPVQIAWQDPPDGEDKKLIFNETAIVVCRDNSLLAIARSDIKPDKKFWQIRSMDHGKTWTKPQKLEVAGGSPALYCASDGTLLLAYRDGGIGPGTALALSNDNGQNWKFLFHLKAPEGEHERLYSGIRWTREDLKRAWRPSEGISGYPCFLPVSSTRVYVVFHAYNRKLIDKFGADVDLYYIAGNLIELPTKN